MTTFIAVAAIVSDIVSFTVGLTIGLGVWDRGPR